MGTGITVTVKTASHTGNCKRLRTEWRTDGRTWYVRMYRKSELLRKCITLRLRCDTLVGIALFKVRI